MSDSYHLHYPEFSALVVDRDHVVAISVCLRARERHLRNSFVLPPSSFEVFCFFAVIRWIWTQGRAARAEHEEA